MTERSVDVASEHIGRVCDSLGYSSSATSRFRLSAEECLLRWMKVFPGSCFDIVTLRRFRKVRVRFELKGNPTDPLKTDYLGEGEGGADIDIVKNVGCVPLYSYIRGRNRLAFTMRKRSLPQFTVILLSIFLGLMVG